MAAIPTYETYLKQGMTDQRVGQLQTALNEANAGIEGYVPLKTDNIFGSKTAQALKQFQQSQNIGVDAIYGPETAGALQNYFNNLNQPIQQTQPMQQSTPQTTQQTVQQAVQQVQQPVQQTPVYQSPYEKQLTDLIDNIAKRYSQGFEYNPKKDEALKQAQEQSMDVVKESMNASNILSSTVTTDRAAQEAQNLIPQYRQIAYGEWADENERLMEFANFYTNLDNQAYDRFVNQWEMDWKQKAFDYQQKLDEFDMQRKNIADAWDRVESVGYVDNETSSLLGLPVGTPSQRAREIMQEEEMQIAAEERAFQRDIALQQQKLNNEIAVLRERERISQAEQKQQEETTSNQLKEYYKWLNYYTGDEWGKPIEEALDWITTGAQDVMYKKLGPQLYSQLVNDLQKAASAKNQPEEKTKTLTIDEIDFLSRNIEDVQEKGRLIATEMKNAGYSDSAILAKLRDEKISYDPETKTFSPIEK